jgi:membrane protease YdiL (CAAX protease family)
VTPDAAGFAVGWLLLAALGAAVLPFWVRRVRACRGAAGTPGSLVSEVYGGPDLIFFSVLILCLAVPAILSVGAPERPLRSADVIAGITMYGVLLAGVFAAVKLRGRSMIGLFRLGAVGVPRVGARAGLHLAAAYPLVLLAMLTMQRLMPGSPHQSVVDFLVRTESSADRLTVALAAVLFAPLAEEVIFRGYLHGVLRRYVGVVPSALLISTLFAAVHVNALHFPALLLLGLALTFAYESEGSLAVPIVMHALFNGISVLGLLWSAGVLRG